MASLNSIIEIREEYRPCLVKGKKALFHRWIERSEIVSPSIMVGEHGGGIIKAPFAIVEYENGEVAEVNPTAIEFQDDLIKQYCFKEAD
jgi:hypothetical protein